MIYRMEAKKVVRRVRKVGNFHIFAAIVSREAAQRRWWMICWPCLVASPGPVVAHLIGAGKLTLEDVEYAENTLKALKKGTKYDR